MKKKSVRIKNAKVKALLRQGGRKGAKADFFELVKRAALPNGSF